MKSSKVYDLELAKVKHYTNFPAMMPFVGPHYSDTDRMKIMLVGEINYLPPNCTVSENHKQWYKSTQSNLNKKEIEWLHCRNLVESRSKSPGLMFYRKLEIEMSERLGISSQTKALSTIVYMNGFQRPLPQSATSIKKFCRSIDIEIGVKTIDQVIDIMKPDVVLFISKLAWEKLGKRLAEKNLNKGVEFTCHSGMGGRYVRKKDYEHSVEKVKKLI